MSPSLIEIGSKTAEKNSAQTNKQIDRQINRDYENNGHLAVNQNLKILIFCCTYAVAVACENRNVRAKIDARCTATQDVRRRVLSTSSVVTSNVGTESGKVWLRIRRRLTSRCVHSPEVARPSQPTVTSTLSDRSSKKAYWSRCSFVNVKMVACLRWIWAYLDGRGLEKLRSKIVVAQWESYYSQILKSKFR